VTPRISSGLGQEVEEGIHAVRMLLARCWFDGAKCKPGLEALQHYRRDYNQRLNEFKATPVHDWASHAADAFRSAGWCAAHESTRRACG
jgi:phage terminase large subunit